VLNINLADEDATLTLARDLARITGVGDILALRGELGTGKTAFARAFITARRGEATEVPSPTFTLVQTYDDGQAAIYHFDLFRLTKPDEALELGIEDAFADGITLIEWPERLESLLPDRRLEIDFFYGETPEARIAWINGGADWTARLAEAGLG